LSPILAVVFPGIRKSRSSFPACHPEHRSQSLLIRRFHPKPLGWSVVEYL
jgi:hypothetical protein